MTLCRNLLGPPFSHFDLSRPVAPRSDHDHPLITPTGEFAMRVPITGHAVGVSDTVERAMEMLKDRKDPTLKPSTDPQLRSTNQSHGRHGRSWGGAA
jgi:hypothetical protein